MKKLKKVLSILLIIPVMFLFVACGGDPEEPSTGGNGGSQGTVSLTVSDSFSVGKEMVDSFFDGYAEEDLLKTNYATNIKKDVGILNAVADLLEDYTPLYWHYGIEVAAEDGEVNKLNKFYIDDTSTNEKIDVEVVMLFSYDGLNEKYSYRFYCIDVEVVKATNEIVIECFCEESYVQGTNNSTANYHSFKMTGNCGELKEVASLNYYTFDRNTIISEPSSLTVDNNTIEEFEGCKITKGQNSVFYSKNDSGSAMANENSVQAGLALNIVSRLSVEIRQIPIALMLLENGSSLLCPLVNA